jgi:hypothetical protein
MNTVFKIMTTISFVGVVAIAGTGAYVYANKEAIIDSVKAEVTEAITEALPGLIGGGLPEVPSVGGASSLPDAPISLPGF